MNNIIAFGILIGFPLFCILLALKQKYVKPSTRKRWSFIEWAHRKEAEFMSK